MPRCIYHKGGGGAAGQLTFRQDFNKSGYANLPPELTINGVTKTPIFRYEGGSATPTVWTATYGSDLAVAGAGDSPVVDEYAPGLTDKRVDFSEGKSFAGSTISTTTEDIVFEAIVKVKNLSSTYSIVTNVSSAPGIQFYHSTTSSVLTMYIRDSTPTVVTFNTPNLSIGEYYHLICFIDKSGSGICYANGVAGTAVNVSSVGSIASALPLTVGAGVGSVTSEANVSVSYLSMWQGTGWLDTHLQATVAKERFHKACGIYPQLAKGTSAPSVATRSTVAYIDKLDSSGNRLLVPVGAEWMRVCEREDSNGDTLAGYLPEIAGQNKCLQSEDIATTWSKTQAADSFDLNSIAAPDGTLTADGMIAANAALPHGVRQDITVTAVQWVFSVFAKKGNLDWLCMHDDDVADADAWFDLDNGVVGTKAAGCTSSGIEAWGNGWYRCWIEVLGTAAAHTFVVHSAEADNDETFNGDGSTVNTYVWGMQCEIGSIPSSYIKTTTAAVTRNKDELQFVAGANIGGEDVGQGTISYSILVPDYTVSPYSSDICLSDGGNSTDRFLVYNNSTSIICFSNGGNLYSAVIDTSDGEIHVIKVRYASNDVSTTVDGTAAGSTTTAVIPDDIDRIDIGQDQGSIYQINGLIGKIKIYKKPVR